MDRHRHKNSGRFGVYGFGRMRRRRTDERKFFGERRLSYWGWEIGHLLL